MIHNLQLRVDPRTAATPLLLKARASSALDVDANAIRDIVVKKRSIDARQRRVMVNLTVDVYVGEDAPQSPLLNPVCYGDVSTAPQAIVVGAGPAGLFAALRLIELGVRPIILERGKDVDARRVDMAQISRNNVVDPDSNYCFGEGGAGAFSDGKLYTRSKKRGNVEKILQIFCQHGASSDILVDAHPHIGTDRLPVVIKAMRDTIIRCGG
ncbi:MAG: FAD-dependent monooxygenase, partial [Muribaculaceae bacterium]|nr:FAD-dependent monooxygenase [Muribaculaceae bacterium]